MHGDLEAFFIKASKVHVKWQVMVDALGPLQVILVFRQNAI
jgi:hypothetical protein